MSDHSELVAEIATVEKMTTPERLKHARKRRSQQLKRYANYEKQFEKDKTKKNKQSQSQQRSANKKARVKFIHNIMLLDAAARNDVDEVRKLLMAGISPDVTNEDGLTALHQCCIDDSEDMVKLLLEFGAGVNARDSEMWTPLHAAATCGHVHLCKTLIDKGAELLAVNADGNMPYDICEDEVCLDAIETEMAKRGITQEDIDEKRLETESKMLNDLKKIAANKGDLEVRDKNLATPLHVAAANGYIVVVEFLLNQHVSLDVREEDGWLPIHAAAYWSQPEVIEMLVKHGADIDAKTKTGETAFDLAGDPDVKQKVLDLKDELENHRASQTSAHIRNRRVNTRSASIRRTSMRGEKRPLFKKEAQEEAKHFGIISDGDDSVTLKGGIEESPATTIDEVEICIIDDKDDGHQKELLQIDNNEKHNEKNNVDMLYHAKTNKVVSISSKSKEQGTELIKDSLKPRDNNSASGNKIAQMSAHTDSSHTKKVDMVQWKPGSTINDNDTEAVNIYIGHATTKTNPESDQPLVLSSDKPSADNQGKASVSRASFQKKHESQKRHSEKHLAQASSDNTVPVVGTLADLKKHRSEQYKGNGNSLDAQVQDLFLHNLGTNGKKYGSGSLQLTQPGGKESLQNGRNLKSVNNISSLSRPPTLIQDNETLRRYSSPSSAPVIGGDDDKFQNHCCVIV